jgi:aspartate/glutamate racemase
MGSPHEGAPQGAKNTGAPPHRSFRTMNDGRQKNAGLQPGVESTRVCYDLLIQGARQPGGDPLENPEIVIYSLNLTEVVQLQRTGTRVTMEAGMYPGEFSEAEIEIVIPVDGDRGFLDDVIYGELALGIVQPQVRQRILDICAKHIQEDQIDAVILGCTELPLVISGNDLSIAVVDTTVAHVEAILASAS